MNCNKSLKVILVFIFFSFFVPFSKGAVKFYQSSEVKGNGTIAITISYAALNSEIKNGLIGSLPFTAEFIKEYFSFPSSEIKKTAIYKDQANPNITNVTIDLIVKDLSKISGSKVLNGIKAGLSKKDTGSVFTWLIPVSFMKSNSIDTYQFLLGVDGDLKSTNGVLKDKICNWYVYGDKMNEGGAYFLATFKPNPNTANKDESPSDTTSDGNGKSCGLFGLELPILLLGGLVISQRIKKSKS